MALNDTDDAFVRWTIRNYVRQWGGAVQRQRERVASNVDDDGAFETDVHLYAVSLNRLARMVKWAMRHAKAQEDHGLAGRLGKPMKDFKRAAPDYKEIRDIHEHIEDYELGQGQLQDEPEPGEDVLGLSRWYSEDEVNMVGRRLDVNTSADAAALLAEQVEALLA